MSMENGISSGGFGVSDKAALESDVGLGLKLLRSTDSFPYNYKTMMMMMVHHHRPFSSPPETLVGCGGDHHHGPTCNGGPNEVCRSMTDIYDVDVAGAASASASAASGGAVVRTLQPFHISNHTSTTSTSTNTAFKSPAGGMAASLGFPFTTAQWKELERQAMIYKYMMASVPVPPELLIPITRNLSDSDPSSTSHSPLGRGSIFNMRFSNSTDPEPWRCRRTDGKKWRCSRDVAPHQKYCERHMHRGRPRSRKPVEVHADLNNNNNNNKKTRHHHHPTTLSNPTVNTNGSSSHHYLGSTTSATPTQSYHHIPPFDLEKSNDKASPFESVLSVPSYKEPRGFDWMMEGDEAVPLGTSDQQWQHLMQTKIGLTTEGSFCDSNATGFHQHYESTEPLNLNSYTDFTETPRGFIDAWSNDESGNSSNDKKSSVSSNERLSLSSLTLSMAGGNTIDDEMGRIQMGLGIMGSDHINNGGSNYKPQLSSWLNPVSWVASTPGGPLAEVLRPSSVAAVGSSSNPASPHAGNGHSGSPPATTVSSPSGVLQKTLASLSDSSGNSSPTLAASTARPEIVFQWSDQAKLASTS